MNDFFEKDCAMFFMGAFCGAALVALALALSGFSHRAKFEAEAIKAGAARYEVEGRNKTKFVWIIQSKETTTP
jgi:hypothetical protein